MVLGDGMQLFRPRGAVSMQEFQGRLYIGTDRPTELIRINPDDSWDLVVGPPRMTASGYKRPLSGIAGRGFNNFFTGHLYTMAVHDGTLYVGTWDWSQGLEDTPLKGLFNYTYGFDFFKSRDGVNWSVVDRNGLGDPKNLAIRNLESTPFGLFVAVANSHFGLQIFQNRTVLDLDRSGAIDSRDVNLLLAGRGPAKGPTDSRDLDRDGWITVNDARKLATQCTAPACATMASKTVSPPSSLMAGAGQVTGSNVALSWTASPEAATYHVYRADPVTLESVVPPGSRLPLPNGTTVGVEDLKDGVFDALCRADASEQAGCALVEALHIGGLGGKAFRWIGSTPELSFADPNPPASGQALYYVAAQDARGRISEPTNLVAAPSDAEAPTLARLGDAILRLNGALPRDTIQELGRSVSVAATAVSEGRLADAQVAVAGIGVTVRGEWERGAMTSNASVDALHVVESLDHYLRLAAAGRVGNVPTRMALLGESHDIGPASGHAAPLRPSETEK